MADIFQAIFQFICLHNANAHWIICGLILLAGLNVPISEDFLLLSAGALASTYFTQGTFYMFGLVFAACLISGWEAYWMGRLLGPKLLQIRWFGHILPQSRIDKIEYFYKKYGILTFIVGRFIPGGVRNALFLSSGLTKMPFLLFMRRDFVGCLLASSVVFYLGYLFGSNSQTIFHYMEMYERGFLILFSLLIGGLVFFQLYTRKLQTEYEEK